MTSLKEKTIETDVLVVGAGGAGCFAAIKAQEKGVKVMMVNKVPWLGGCTMMGRAGFSAALGATDPRDNPDVHFHDSVRAGDYMGNQKVLKVMCHRNVEATLDLIQWGAGLRKGSDGRLDQRDDSEGVAGHTYARRVRVAGEFSHIGKTIMDVLQTQIRERGIEVISNVMITKLLHSQGSIVGAVGLNWREGSLILFKAKAVVMASGGVGRLFKYTDNPTYMTGDGHAVMYEAGAELVDMEFCDFQMGVYHPPRMFGYPPNCGAWLANGAMLLNRDGERIFKRYLADRANEGKLLRTEYNRVAAWEILDGRGSPNGMIYLNCSNVRRDWMMTARADIVSHLKRGGIDLAWQPMEVAPGLHSFLGGLRIDENGESMTIKGLYGAGEAAGGWGGSNRLGGNAIAAALSLGIVAGESAAERSKQVSMPKVDEEQMGMERRRIREIIDRQEGVRPKEVKSQVQDLMQKNVWLRRDEKGLKSAMKEIEKMEENDLPRLYVPRGREMQRYLGLREALEAINLLACGWVMANAALRREESRGAHQRGDYPGMDNRNWLKNIVQWQEKGKRRLRTEPVVVTEVFLPEKKGNNK